MKCQYYIYFSDQKYIISFLGLKNTCSFSVYDLKLTQTSYDPQNQKKNCAKEVMERQEIIMSHLKHKRKVDETKRGNLIQSLRKIGLKDLKIKLILNLTQGERLCIFRPGIELSDIPFYQSFIELLLQKVVRNLSLIHFIYP